MGEVWPVYLLILIIATGAVMLVLAMRLRQRRLPPDTGSPDESTDLATVAQQALTSTPTPIAAGASQVAAAQQASEGPKGPVCPRCNAPLTPRAAAGQEIWLCSRFPKCNYGTLKEN